MEMNLASIIIDRGKRKRYHTGVLILLGGGILIALILILGG